MARGDISLTYFEFGALAALWVFRESGVAYQLLEVGLGGRLDAVNIIDADVAVVTAIGLDHQEWLGSDVETIAMRKVRYSSIGKPHCRRRGGAYNCYAKDKLNRCSGGESGCRLSIFGSVLFLARCLSYRLGRA